MNAVEFFLLFQKLKSLHIPSDMATVRHDLEIFHRSNEPLFLLFEVSLVTERQRGLARLSTSRVNCEGRLALRVEMSFQWS